MKVELLVPQFVDVATLAPGDVFARDPVDLLYVVVGTTPASAMRATDGSPSALPPGGTLVVKYPNATLVAQP